MKKRFGLYLMLAAALAVFFTARHAAAETMTCNILSDVTIDEWYPDENFNYKDRLTVATNKNIHHGIARVLLLFDIPGDLEAADIKSAEIYLSGCYHCGGGNGGDIGFFALNSPFGEDNDTWNTLHGGDWDESVYAEALLPAGSTWNTAENGQISSDAEGMETTGLLQDNLEKVRSNGIMMRFLDEHQEPCTHQNIASRESEDPLDFAPCLVITTKESEPGCPAEAVLENDAAALKALRLFRDRVLAKTPEGRKLIRLYYRHGLEIQKLFLSDNRLKREARHGLKNLLPHIISMNASGNLHIPKELRTKAETFLASFEDKAGGQLKADLTLLRKTLLR